MILLQMTVDDNFKLLDYNLSVYAAGEAKKEREKRGTALARLEYDFDADKFFLTVSGL